MKKKINKFVKIGGAVLGISAIFVIYLLASAKPMPPSGLDLDADNIHMYDDMEFYEMTHNEDGTLNDYGKNLI